MQYSKQIKTLLGDDEKSSSEDEDGKEDAEWSETLKGGYGEDEEGGQKKGGLHARDIDAHWIQRSLSKFYKVGRVCALGAPG